MNNYSALRKYADSLAVRQAPLDEATAAKYRQELWEAERAAEDARPQNQAYNPYRMSAVTPALNKFFGF